MIAIVGAPAGALALTSAVIWALGGFDKVEGGQVKAGDTIDQRRFDTQILDARSGVFDLDKSSTQQPKDNRLVVRMRVTNRDAQTLNVSDPIRGIEIVPQKGQQLIPPKEPGLLDGIKGFPEPDSRIRPNQESRGLTGDDTETENLQPRLPIMVEAIWKLPAGSNPRSITIVARRWDYLKHGFTTKGPLWTVQADAKEAATLTIPVRSGATS